MGAVLVLATGATITSLPKPDGSVQATLRAEELVPAQCDHSRQQQSLWVGSPGSRVHSDRGWEVELPDPNVGHVPLCFNAED